MKVAMKVMKFFGFISLYILIPTFLHAVALDTIYCSTVDEIHTAFKTAQAGDRIIITPGEYYGNDSKSGSSKGAFYCAAEGTFANPIYVQSADTSQTVSLIGEGVNNDYVLYITGDNWIIDGLEIRKGKKGIMLDNSDFTILRNLAVHEIGEEGIHLRDGSFLLFVG